MTSETDHWYPVEVDGLGEVGVSPKTLMYDMIIEIKRQNDEMRSEVQFLSRVVRQCRDLMIEVQIAQRRYIDNTLDKR